LTYKTHLEKPAVVAPKRKRNAEKPKVAFGSSAATTNTDTNTPQSLNLGLFYISSIDFKF
jgi:hypothetical protein